MMLCIPNKTGVLIGVLNGFFTIYGILFSLNLHSGNNIVCWASQTRRKNAHVNYTYYTALGWDDYHFNIFTASDMYIKGFRPEWLISTIYHAWDTPFWSGTLDML